MNLSKYYTTALATTRASLSRVLQDQSCTTRSRGHCASC
jgi:hypothetical protein